MKDTIYRDDAIEAVASRDETDGTVKVFTGRQVNEILSALPSAEAEQGEWIKRGTKISCSNCKCAWSTSFDTIVAGMRFCPMCGSKMTKGGDSE